MHITSASTCRKYQVPARTACSEVQSRRTLGNFAHVQKKKDPGFRMRRRICEAPRPRITNALRKGKQTTAEIIAKATQHLRVQVILFWKAKNTLHHMSERKQRGQNNGLYFLKPYTRDREHAKKRCTFVRSTCLPLVSTTRREETNNLVQRAAYESPTAELGVART